MRAAICNLKAQVKDLLYQIKSLESEALASFGIKGKEETMCKPPVLTFILDFHKKYDSWKSTHPIEYYKNKESAYVQQISILKTQLRILEGKVKVLPNEDISKGVFPNEDLSE